MTNEIIIHIHMECISENSLTRKEKNKKKYWTQRKTDYNPAAAAHLVDTRAGSK